METINATKRVILAVNDALITYTKEGTGFQAYKNNNNRIYAQHTDNIELFELWNESLYLLEEEWNQLDEAQENQQLQTKELLDRTLEEINKTLDQVNWDKLDKQEEQETTLLEIKEETLDELRALYNETNNKVYGE